MNNPGNETIEQAATAVGRNGWRDADVGSD
jgi:hypothetical protein